MLTHKTFLLYLVLRLFIWSKYLFGSVGCTPCLLHINRVNTVVAMYCSNIRRKEFRIVFITCVVFEFSIYTETVYKFHGVNSGAKLDGVR